MEENVIAEDLLSEQIFENVKASSGKRFGNYIIDRIVFYVVTIGIGAILVSFSPTLLDFVSGDSPKSDIADRLFTYIFYGIFMGIVEGLGKGKTIGKYITGTRAVNEDGSIITFSTGFVRGLTRLVPFNALSALGTPSYPWHDKWTKTFVIDEKLSNYSER
jgi:uncharacterized RDD family membrane protein YckC